MFLTACRKHMQCNEAVDHAHCHHGDGWSDVLAEADASCLCRNKNGQLVLGDIITGIDSRPVKSQKDLFNILDDCKVRILTDRDASTVLAEHMDAVHAGAREPCTWPDRRQTVCQLCRRSQLTVNMLRWQVGQKIKVQVNRQGRPQEVELTLAERDPTMD